MPHSKINPIKRDVVIKIGDNLPAFNKKALTVATELKIGI